jgi:hypothetical protein
LTPIKESWLGVIPSQLISPYPNLSALVAIVIMLMMLMRVAAVVVRPSSVVRRSVSWITAVVVVVAAWVIPVAVAISGITDPDPNASYPD